MRALGLLDPKAKFGNEACDKIEKVFQDRLGLAMQSIPAIEALIVLVVPARKN